jgi:hypothetical protein
VFWQVRAELGQVTPTEDPRVKGLPANSKLLKVVAGVAAVALGMALFASNRPLVRVRRTRSVVTVWFRNFLSICMTEDNDFLPITNVPYGNNFETREYRNRRISKCNISVEIIALFPGQLF